MCNNYPSQFVIIPFFSALINHVTNESPFYERHETSCDNSPKKDMNHFIYLN